jgi:antitoxin (DNA-binding transcriptional repressor) of toxin-antitoxin stability system
VTERGKPIAKLVPLRAGRVRLGSGKLPPGFWRMPRPKDRRGAALKALLAERAGSR